jgi:hypothetical protein
MRAGEREVISVGSILLRIVCTQHLFSSTYIFHHPLSVNLSAFYENPVVPETKY